MKVLAPLFLIYQVLQSTVAAVDPGFQAAQDEQYQYPNPTRQYATPLTSKPQPTYANTLRMKELLTSATYTTWASDASPTDHNRYGDSAWSELWESVRRLCKLPTLTPGDME